MFTSFDDGLPNSSSFTNERISTTPIVDWWRAPDTISDTASGRSVGPSCARICERNAARQENNAEARAYLDARYGALPPYYEGRQWFFPVTEEMHQNVMSFWHTPDSFPVDARAVAYSIAFFSAKHLGESQYYLMSIRDADGDPLDGGASYRLHVTANVPVTQYWSMTVYNRDTHSFIRDARWVGRSSQTPGLQWNADGSADIHFGSTPPTVGESNWIPTDPNGEFEVLARFYGPEPALFDKTWQLPDIAKVS